MIANTVPMTDVQVKESQHLEASRLLTPEALEFIATLHRKFNSRRLELLERRKKIQREINSGNFSSFSKGVPAVRDSAWQVASSPECLQDRRVEITGPVDRKMIINALNSGAQVFMADFEDSNSPTWENIVGGQLNLMDAVRKTIQLSVDGKHYKLNDTVAILKVRPRGWHLEESHILIDGDPASASLVDFGLFFFHNASLLASRQEGPFYYLPKMENHLEARLWNDVFKEAEQYQDIPAGTIKATVLIETILAAFEMEEIMYELRDHLAGLNAGRWDYIFSIIKKFHQYPEFVLPDRSSVTMDVSFMKAYAQQLVKVCHKRGAHAIGGMSAFIPSKDESVNKRAFDKVRTDKEREVLQGYDGTWVAHPRLVEVARSEFDKILNGQPHQKHNMREDFNVSTTELLNVGTIGKTVTVEGFRINVNIALLYLESWLRGTGAAALYNLMEDAATAEISRAQLWQWIYHGVRLEDGQLASVGLYQQVCGQEFAAIEKELLAHGHSTTALESAKEILDDLVLTNHFEEFLTTKAYNFLS